MDYCYGQKRRARFHQWLSEEGRKMLDRQIGRVEAQMEMFESIDKFSSAERKKKMVSIAPYLFDDMNKIIEDKTQKAGHKSLPSLSRLKGVYVEAQLPFPQAHNSLYVLIGLECKIF